MQNIVILHLEHIHLMHFEMVKCASRLIVPIGVGTSLGLEEL